MASELSHYCTCTVVFLVADLVDDAVGTLIDDRQHFILVHVQAAIILQQKYNLYESANQVAASSQGDGSIHEFHSYEQPDEVDYYEDAGTQLEQDADQWVVVLVVQLVVQPGIVKHQIEEQVAEEADCR